MKEKSAIFSKNPSTYQQAINSARYQLCLNNPSLLLERKGALLEMAKKKVHEAGYLYKKGHSRSKVLDPTLSEESKP